MVAVLENIQDWLDRKTLEEDINFYPGPRYYNDEIVINTKTYFHADEKLFGLGCIENDFCKYVAKFYILTILVSHIKIISRNDTLLYYRAS